LGSVGSTGGLFEPERVWGCIGIDNGGFWPPKKQKAPCGA
jgi:hypothetical protein